MRSVRQLIVLVLFGLIVAVMSCKTTSTGPINDIGNLLPNGSFELNGKPTWGHWVLLDTPLDTTTLFAQDVPLLGGNWSLELQPHPPGANYARSFITGTNALGGVFQLTVWGKATNGWPNGSVALGKLSSGFVSILQSKGTPAATWTEYTLEDTLDLVPQDSLFVQLSTGPDDQSILGAVRFDLVKLERIR